MRKIAEVCVAQKEMQMLLTNGNGDNGGQLLGRMLIELLTWYHKLKPNLSNMYVYPLNESSVVIL